MKLTGEMLLDRSGGRKGLEERVRASAVWDRTRQQA